MCSVLTNVLGTKYHFKIIPAKELQFVHFKSDKDTFLIVHIKSGDEEENVGHWICFEYSRADRSAFFYDSYAMDYNIYFRTIPFHVKGRNHIRQQSLTSSNCGKFVVHFIYARALLKLSIKNVLGYFGSHVRTFDTKNDDQVTLLRICCIVNFVKMYLEILTLA